MSQACPVCSKPTVADFRPFCSRRCADVDLHRWLAGAYAIPGRLVEEEEEELAPPPKLTQQDEE